MNRAPTLASGTALGVVLLLSSQAARAADVLGIAQPIETLGTSMQAGFYAVLLIAVLVFVMSLWRGEHGLAAGALMFCFIGAIGSNAAGARDLIFQGALGAEIEAGQIVRPLNAR